MFECKILADSMYEAARVPHVPPYRLTTFMVTAPRFILAEINTHRKLSRNSASSRAIPVKKSIEAVVADPFIPLEFGKNQPGMSASENLTMENTELAKSAWLAGKRKAVEIAEYLDELEVHKGLANRILEPFKWHTCILTGTDWSNFFALRTDANAQPEFRKLALMMEEEYEPFPIITTNEDEWHVPLVSYSELISDGTFPDWDYWKLVSVGRCARVSYLTHLGERDPDADVSLAKRLMTNGHLSPFEHVARPFTQREWNAIGQIQHHIRGVAADEQQRKQLHRQVEYCGNLKGWHSSRADLINEHDFALAREEANG